MADSYIDSDGERKTRLLLLLASISQSPQYALDHISREVCK